MMLSFRVSDRTLVTNADEKTILKTQSNLVDQN
jgi:hypothetical protein